MLHRHLTHQQFTLAAIDNVIARGKRRDWADLRRAALEDRAVLEKVLRVCRAHVSDPYAQRYHFWLNYAEEHLPSAAEPPPRTITVIGEGTVSAKPDFARQSRRRSDRSYCR